MPEVFVCRKCSQVIDEKSGEYQVLRTALGNRPEVRMHPVCPQKDPLAKQS